MPRINENENEQNEQQSVQDRNWQDGSGGNNNPPPNIETPPNEIPLSQEQIPQLSEEEMQAQNRWRNSSEMQEGLREMLPKEQQQGLTESAPSINLDQIRTQSTGKEASNPLQMLIMNFYEAIQTMSEAELNQQLEEGLSNYGKPKTTNEERINNTSKVANTGKMSGALASGATGLNTVNKAADASKAVTGSVASGLQALKDGVMAIKHIYDAYKDATSEEGNTSEDKAIASLQIVKELISSAHGTVSTLQSILTMFGSASEGLKMAIPGLGLALNAVSMSIDVYNLMKAKTNDAFIKKQLGENKWEGTLGKRKKGWFGRKKKIRGKDKRRAQDEYIALFESELGNMSQKEQGLLEEKALYENDPEKTTELEQVNQKLQNCQSAMNLARTELASLKENQALTNLSQINKDRMANASFDIGVQMTSLVGNVLALVPEPSVQLGGVALRSAAAGAVLFKKVGGVIVQKMRDKADKDPDSFLNKIVDSSRSSEREMTRKKESARYIFKKITESDLSDGRSVNALNSFIDATGASPRNVGKAHKAGGVPKAVQTLVDAQGK